MSQEDSRLMKANWKNEIYDIVIIIGTILVGMMIAPLWSGFVGVFIISFSLYMIYVLWPIRHKVVAAIKRDLPNLYNLLRSKHEQQELLVTGSGEAGGNQGSHPTNEGDAGQVAEAIQNEGSSGGTKAS